MCIKTVDVNLCSYQLEQKIPVRAQPNQFLHRQYRRFPLVFMVKIRNIMGFWTLSRLGRGIYSMDVLIWLKEQTTAGSCRNKVYGKDLVCIDGCGRSTIYIRITLLNSNYIKRHIKRPIKKFSINSHEKMTVRSIICTT